MWRHSARVLSAQNCERINLGLQERRSSISGKRALILGGSSSLCEFHFLSTTETTAVRIRSNKG